MDKLKLLGTLLTVLLLSISTNAVATDFHIHMFTLEQLDVSKKDCFSAALYGKQTNIPDNSLAVSHKFTNEGRSLVLYENALYVVTGYEVDAQYVIKCWAFNVHDELRQLQ